SDIHGKDEEFIHKLTQVALANLENEHFRGKELACAAGINYYTLNRRLHSACNKTPNQFIREIRLEKAMEFLLSEEGNIYRVGFYSPAYFNKCFHEFYGFTPGESRIKYHQKGNNNGDNTKTNQWQKLRKNPFVIISFLSFIFLILIFIFLNKRNKAFLFSTDNTLQTSSIAVLPINNFTGDPGLEYFSSGVHDAIIAELGRLDYLVVKSRTSTMQYQNG
ncbi:MAG: helix-turn-helix domain-containing protein, partial [Bacteroidales bacterium]